MWHPNMPEAYRNQIVCGDARQIAERIPDNSIDLIFTDPVYERIEDYAWLAQLATRILKDGGACLVWCSNKGQYDVHRAMSEHLTFILPFTYTKIAKAHKAFYYKTVLWSTPCLWFQKGKPSNTWTIDTVVDVIQGNSIVSATSPPKDTYKWHKNPEAYIRWLQAFSREGDTVYDPFAGSGSLPVECKKLYRNFVASEMKPDIAAKAQQRLDATIPTNPLFIEQAAMF